MPEQVTERTTGSFDTVLNIQCFRCQKVVQIMIRHADLKKWILGIHIQDAFPYLDVNEREIMISRVCGDCYDAMAIEMEEEDS